MIIRSLMLAILIILQLAGYKVFASPLEVAEPPKEQSSNARFLDQKTFDPWMLHNPSPKPDMNALVYVSDGKVGRLIDFWGKPFVTLRAGDYVNGRMVDHYDDNGPFQDPSLMHIKQWYDFYSGMFHYQNTTFGPSRNWPRLWQTSDIVITGDPEAQQVTHANLFYLLSSTYPGSDHSIPPYGLSIAGYGGHIFWDADVWMMPALLVQHPKDAKGIIDYRFKMLAQAKKSAKAHGFAGAEYPWESADTGKEVAPKGMERERHITADVGWATWQYYLWTGDKDFLAKKGWPILSATAAYWVSRTAKGEDGKYHIKGVISPDEDAGIVNDDAWTNAVVQANLRAAARAVKIMRQVADPQWKAISNNMYFAFDNKRRIPAENTRNMDSRFVAKQADVLLLIYPLNIPFDKSKMGHMLDFYGPRISTRGPSMTAGMEVIGASRIGRRQESLDLFHASYRPFMRGPWDAFSEQAGGGTGYFCTGMGGCLQSVLYGFAGLRVVTAGEKGLGTKVAGDSEASLYADPHLPPGWSGLIVKGVRFRGKSYDVAVTIGNKVMVTPK
jgi:trehalose/maltose hydrolase-like predicted phosphorylase